MTVLRNLLPLLIVATLFAGCAAVDERAGQPDWRLVPATEASDSRHLIVTIALEDPQRMDVVRQRLEETFPVQLVAEWPLAAIDVHCLVFRAADGTDMPALTRRLMEDDQVRTAQPMQQFSLMGTGANDDYTGLQSALVAINALKAHQLATGMDVRVAIVDTGVDVTHPDLADRVVTARDFVGVGTGPPAREVHGTAVAGVIVADAANGKGITGVAPDARLLALRGCWQEDGSGQCSSFSLARAINFAIANRAQVLNLSLAGPYDPLLAELIDAAIDRGVIVVAAEGLGDEHDFPASLSGVISAGSAVNGRSWAESEPRVLPAPAVDVITTTPGGGYDFFSGSSVAAAHVSGVAALMLQREPELTPLELRLALAKGVTGADGEGPDAMLDSCRAVLAGQGAELLDRC